MEARLPVTEEAPDRYRLVPLYTKRMELCETVLNPSTKERTMSNVYYSPELFGLTVVAELSKEPDYDFDILVVWQHTDGTLYWAHDSGCSCPTPFEEYGGLDDLYKLDESRRELRQMAEYMSQVSEEERMKFLMKVGA